MTDQPNTTTPPAVPPLTNLTEEERARALERFRLLRPYLENQSSLLEVTKVADVSSRTCDIGSCRHCQEGLTGLARKTRRDKQHPKIAATLLKLIEGLALQKPPLSAAAIQRQVAAVAKDHTARRHQATAWSTQWFAKSPRRLSTMAQRRDQSLQPVLRTSVHRRRRSCPTPSGRRITRNWTSLPNDERRGTLARRGLTIILDDYSRAAAGYFLTFHALLQKSKRHWACSGRPSGERPFRRGTSAGSPKCSIPTMARISPRAISSR